MKYLHILNKPCDPAWKGVQSLFKLTKGSRFLVSRQPKGGEPFFIPWRFMKRTDEQKKNEFGLPGIGIPAEVLIHPELTGTEKLLFGLIKNLSYTEKGCWASNKWLGEMLGKRPQTITNGVAHLKEHGFITINCIQRGDGRQIRRIYISKTYEQKYSDMIQEAYKIINRGVLKNLYGGIKKLIPPYKKMISNKDIDRDINGGIDSIGQNGKLSPLIDVDTTNPKQETKELFTQFWKDYPRKVNKKKAWVSWKSLFLESQKNRTQLFPKIMKALSAQKSTPQWKEGIIPHPTTWLNGERWEDDPAGMKSFSNTSKKPSTGYKNKKARTYKTEGEV